MHIVDWLTQFGQRTGTFALMTSAWGWPLIESLHFLSLTALLGTVGVFDLRVLGLARSIAPGALHRLIPVGVAAFLVSLITGFLFLVTEPRQYVYNPAFQLKLLCMGLAGINALIFYWSRARAALLLPAGVPAPWQAKLGAAISLASWLAVIVCGRVITAFRPPYHWCFWCG
jgi:uncharacterized membrane protein